jgi:hypothetical protein
MSKQIERAQEGMQDQVLFTKREGRLYNVDEGGFPIEALGREWSPLRQEPGDAK